MKAFIKKIKRSNKVLLSLLVISLIAYIIGYVKITINLIHLTGIETIIRTLIIVFSGLWILIWLILGLVFLFTKKNSKFIITLIFTILFTTIFFVASYYIDSIYGEINNMSKSTITYTTDLIALNDTEFNDSSKIGIISDTTNTEGYILAKKLISKENLQNELLQYDDFYLMLEALYNGEIDACFVSGNYTVLFGSEEIYQNIENETKIIKTYSEEMENQDNQITSTKSLTEPFTILVMGVDSENDGLNANAAFNGDTLMMVTFNPKTLSASMFSLPRDLYVPIACRGNALAKINSSAAYGSTCVMNTIENLTGIEIDYYVKMNFKGVVDLVDALGGITVNVEEPYFNVNNGIDYHGQVCEQNSNRDFGSSTVCINPGEQRLNGEQALAYSRNRHQYIGSDLDRIRHQQDVVQAMFQEMKNLTSFDDFKKVLNTVQKNMDTNLTTEQILSLYNVGKSVIVNAIKGDSFQLSIKRSTLETYSLPVYLGSSTTSALGYYRSSLDDITKMMRINLGLEEEETIKTFSIDYNENYETEYYGKGYYNYKSVETMPNLIGSSIGYVESWASGMNVYLNKVTVYPGDAEYNSYYGTDYVVDQSIHINSIISSGTTLTVYVNGTSNGTEVEYGRDDTTTTPSTNNETNETIDNNNNNEESNNSDNNESSNNSSSGNNNDESNNNQEGNTEEKEVENNQQSEPPTTPSNNSEDDE